jgi:hypothetical protein
MLASIVIRVLDSFLERLVELKEIEKHYELRVYRA